MIIDSQNIQKNYFKELLTKKDLLWELSKKAIIVQYKQSILGLIWSFLNPLITLVLMFVIFQVISRVPSQGAPYPIIIFAALLPWNFFAQTFKQLPNSVTSNTELISKVYFPRILLPFSFIVKSVIEFLINLFLFIVLIIIFNFIPSQNIIFLPIPIILTLILLTGLGLIVSAAAVKYRDIKSIVPHIVQILTYASPVGYSLTLVPKEFLLFYSLNPMVGIIELSRWSVIGSEIYLPSVIISIIISVLSLIIGIFYFKKAEIEFADIL